LIEENDRNHLKSAEEDYDLLDDRLIDDEEIPTLMEEPR
jgi:hypothetical protein